MERLHECPPNNVVWMSSGPEPPIGGSGARTWPNARGAPCAKTTAPTATHGATSRTIRRGAAPIAGTRTGCSASPTIEQRLCFALALWNGADAILKERPFGLTGHEGNHGEDAKDYWFYLDNLPSHAYMKRVVQVSAARVSIRRSWSTESARRGRDDPEYRVARHRRVRRRPLLRRDRRVREGSPTDMLVRITVANRGPDAATLDLLPTLWFRNTWTWGATAIARRSPRSRRATGSIAAPRRPRDARPLPSRRARATPELLFTENETNTERLFGAPNEHAYVKDAFHDYVVHGRDGRGESGARREPKRRRATTLTIPRRRRAGRSAATLARA